MHAAIQRGIDSFTRSWDSDEPARMMAGFLDAMRRRKLGLSHGGNEA
jgi:hypothetical protein